MPAVWYVGRWNEYNISTESWESSVGSALPPQVWNASNGWSVSHSVLTQEQLDMLEQMNDFRIGQANGPRVFPAPPPIADPEDDTASSYTYYLAIKEIVENFVPTNVTIDATNFVLKTPDSLKGAKFQIPAGQTTLTTRTHILPAVDSTLASLAGTEDLSNKTLTAPILSGTVTGTYVLDGAVTIDAPILSGTVTGTYTLGGTPTFPSTVVLTTGAQTLATKTLSSPILNTPLFGQTYNVAGTLGLNNVSVTNAANFIRLESAISGVAPTIRPQGTVDTDIGLIITPIGTGRVTVTQLSATNAILTSPNVNSLRDTNGVVALTINPTASAVNYFFLVPGATANSVSMRALGSDADISLGVHSKGLGSVVLRDGAGTPLLLANPVASAVNYYQMTNAAAAGSPIISVVGSDVNIDFIARSKGTGGILFQSNTGLSVMRLYPVASTANYLRVFSSVTGSPVLIDVIGDTNAGLTISGQGTGRVTITNLTTSGQAVMLDPRLNRVFDYTNNVEVMRFNGAVGAVNFLSFSAAIAGVPLFFSASGTDTDIGMNFVPKGAGRATVTNLSATSAILTSPRIVTAIYDTNGAIALAIIPTASAVNYVQITNNAATGPVYISANGTDTNIQIYLRSRGTGAILFADGSGVPILVAQPTASAVNYFQMVSAAASGVVYLQAVGSDTNIPMAYYSKGSGYIAFESLQNGRILRLQAGTAATVNYVNITSGITTVGPTIAAAGETNVQLNITGAGSSGVRITGSTAGISVLGVGTDTTTAVVVSRDNSAVTSMLRVTSAGLTANAGVQEILRIDPVISQTAAGGYRMISVNMTATSTGSGEKSLIWLGVASTAKFQVTDDAEVFMGNAASPPATPTGGGIMYVEAGALKYKGSSGTVTVLAPA